MCQGDTDDWQGHIVSTCMGAPQQAAITFLGEICPSDDTLIIK